MNELKQRAFALLNAWTTGVASPLADIVDAAFEEIEHPQVTAKGLAGLQTKLAHFHKVHANVTLRLHRQIAQADHVCTQWVMTATVKPQNGAVDAAGQTLVLPGISWTYFSAEGKIVKNRIYGDIVGLLLQRGFRWAEPGEATVTPAEEVLQ